MLDEKILNEGTITAEAWAEYLYNKCLKDKVKQHLDKFYSIPSTILQTWITNQGNNVSFIPVKINKLAGGNSETRAYTKFIFDVLKFFKNKKIDVSEETIKRAVDFYGKLSYGKAAAAVGYASVITEASYFNY